MSKIDLCVRGAKMVTSFDVIEGNLYIHKGKILAVGQLEAPANEVVDAGGLLLLPGMVDAHVHFMDPGDTSREDFPTGSAAAAKAGVTTVIEHTHASPVYNKKDLQDKIDYLCGRSFIDFGIAAHFPLADVQKIDELIQAGAAFIKVFTCTTHGIKAVRPGPLYKAMSQNKNKNVVFLVHAEDDSITEIAESELRASGREDGRVIPEWRNRLAEEVAVNTIAMLAEASGAKVVIAHCSYAGIIDIVAKYRARGVNLWAECCAQYLILKEHEIEEMKGLRKFTPPARGLSDEDLELMWERLRDGRISYIASDHAPATRSQKEGGSIWDIPFGLPGIDTTLPLMLDAAAKGRLSYPRLVDIYSRMPAWIYGLYPRKGALQVGSDADFILVDPDSEYLIKDSDIVSKAGWTPYSGRTVRGKILATFLGGKKIAENNGVTSTSMFGKYVQRCG